MMEIQEINRVIAEAMGWKLRTYHIGDITVDRWADPDDIEHHGGILMLNPMNSDADFWQAIDDLFKPDQTSIAICEQDGAIWFQLYDRKTKKQYDGFGKTRLEAGCLTLVEYIKDS